MDDQFEKIPIEKIIDPWVLLRPVGHETIEFLEMKTSLGEVGFLNSISVRACKRKPGFYEVIDGLWRTHCARELDFDVIPCLIKHGISDNRVLSLQIQANAIRPDTKPIEYARQIQRIQKEKPDLTMAQLSSLINKNPTWVRQQIGLLRLEGPTQKAIDRGEMPLNNAYMLSKIPPKLRPNYVDLAKTMPAKAFKALAAGVIKQFKEAVKRGRLEDFFEADFQAQSYLRSLKEIEAEVDSRSAAPFVISAAKCEKPLDAWVLALKWALHLDKLSVEEQEEAAKNRVRKKWKGD